MCIQLSIYLQINLILFASNNCAPLKDVDDGDSQTAPAPIDIQQTKDKEIKLRTNTSVENSTESAPLLSITTTEIPSKTDAPVLNNIFSVASEIITNIFSAFLPSDSASNETISSDRNKDVVKRSLMTSQPIQTIFYPRSAELLSITTVAPGSRKNDAVYVSFDTIVKIAEVKAKPVVFTSGV
jgi:hypothetical protein